MIDKRGERHRYGQHYTPPEVARLLAAFAVQSADDTVFDPACGDGRLLRETINLKKSMASRREREGERIARSVFGVDRSASAIKLARATGACVSRADFFDIESGAKSNGSLRLPPEFDALIGNPPYIRQEVIGQSDKLRLAKRLEGDRLLTPEIFWPRWSGRSDIYVYFFAHSIPFLKMGGRLVFLTASSWLDAGYGLALREFLARNFRVLAIIESSAESFFSDASINTAITVLARESDSDARNANLVKFVRLTRSLSEILSNSSSDSKTRRSVRAGDDVIEFAHSIENADASITQATHRVRVINQAELTGRAEGEDAKPIKQTRMGNEWGKYLRADDVFFRVVERGSQRLKPLSDLARVRFGVKTGANDFFYVVEPDGNRMKGDAAKRSNKAGIARLGDVARVRRGLTTGANDFFYLKVVNEKSEQEDTKRRSSSPLRMVEDRSGAHHLIESEYLSPVLFSLKEIPRIVIEREQTNKLFFNCSSATDELIGTSALEYVRGGERAGYHLRPTCAARDPWYAVARGMKPAPLIFPAKVGERWLVALNRAGVFEDKKLYGIFPRKEIGAIALAALLNSTWARYYAEITCRQMTGAQAIADIDVAVAERILVPDPRRLSLSMKKKLEAALDALAKRTALSVFEEVKRADRRRLDMLTLEAIGFTRQVEREEALKELYAAVVELVRARLAR